GPWRADGFEVMAARGQFYGGLILGADDVVVAQMVSAANAPLIAACDPDTIRELLAERDRLAAEVEAWRNTATRCWARLAEAEARAIDTELAWEQLKLTEKARAVPRREADDLNGAIDEAEDEGRAIT